MPNQSDSINGGEAGRYSPSFSDVLFQNERAMWRAEFDSIGEDAVRSYVERNSIPPTGMEAAREWLAEREVPQSQEDVPSNSPPADQVQGTSAEFPKGASEELASKLDANSRAIAEMAANARKTARTMVFFGMAAFLLALCAIVMVFVSSRQVAPNTQQASVRVAPDTKQASVRPSPPKQPLMRSLPPALPPAETDQTSAIPPENPQREQASNAPAMNPPELKREDQSAAEALAQIADKLSGEGTINFAALVYDMATGRDHIEHLSYRASNVTIDPNRCQLGYRWHVERNGAVSDQDRTVELRLAKSIRVTTIDAEPNHRFVMHADPKVYVVHIARWDNSSGDHLYFRKADMAARVATATRRALELCDNGKQQFRRR